MGFWEFLSNATPPVGITAVTGWVIIEKDIVTALVVWCLGMIVYLIYLDKWTWRENMRIRTGR